MPGLGIVGTPLLAALQQLVPGTEGYAVMYPATADFFTSAAVGTADAVGHIQSRAVQCPNTMFALGGYSQGTNLLSIVEGCSDFHCRRYGHSRHEA